MAAIISFFRSLVAAPFGSDREPEQQQQARDAATIGRHQDLVGSGGERLLPGRIKTLVARDPPFGFLTPEGGGRDLYFNERLLGGGMNWEAFKKQVAAYPAGMALVLYQLDDSSDRPRAKGVIVLDSKQLHELDENRDSHISKEEMRKFLQAHPELKDECLTKQEREYFRREERDKERETLFRKHDAEEDALYERRNAARSEAQRLRAEGDRLWSQERRSEAKQLHQQAKQKQEEANQWQQTAVELTWKHNEEMFQAVQRSHSSSNSSSKRGAADAWIDLHGLDPDFAAHKTAERLSAAHEQGLRTMLVITGAGHHSGRRGPVVKKRVLEMLNNPPPGSALPLGLSVQAENDGALLVTLPAGRRRPAPERSDPEEEERPRKCARLLGMLCPRRCLALFSLAPGPSHRESDRQALA